MPSLPPLLLSSYAAPDAPMQSRSNPGRSSSRPPPLFCSSPCAHLPRMFQSGLHAPACYSCVSFSSPLPTHFLPVLSLHLPCSCACSPCRFLPPPRPPTFAPDTLVYGRHFPGRSRQGPPPPGSVSSGALLPRAFSYEFQPALVRSFFLSFSFFLLARVLLVAPLYHSLPLPLSAAAASSSLHSTGRSKWHLPRTF